MLDSETRSPQPPRLAIWGTFDTGKPRVRMLVEAAKRLDPDLSLVHRNPWKGIEDKTQIKGLLSKIKIFIAWVKCYPYLIWEYFKIPKHEIVIVPYLGNFDVFFLWPIARLRGAKICWDMFISLYDTIVEDRKLLSTRNIVARLLYRFEHASIRLSDMVLIDTQEHARYIANLYQVSPTNIQSMWVGSETDLFRPALLPYRNGPVKILFYGQFIPLHGLETLVEAIHIVNMNDTSPEIQFTIIGTGQESPRIDHLIYERKLNNLHRINWINYNLLPKVIDDCDICLGIFAGEGKSARVIPNKVFQIMAVGRPLITRDSPAIRELVEPSLAIHLVKPENPAELASTIIAIARDLRTPGKAEAIAQAAAIMPCIDIETIAAQLSARLENL